MPDENWWGGGCDRCGARIDVITGRPVKLTALIYAGVRWLLCPECRRKLA